MKKEPIQITMSLKEERLTGQIYFWVNIPWNWTINSFENNLGFKITNTMKKWLLNVCYAKLNITALALYGPWSFTNPFPNFSLRFYKVFLILVVVWFLIILMHSFVDPRSMAGTLWLSYLALQPRVILLL